MNLLTDLQANILSERMPGSVPAVLKKYESSARFKGLNVRFRPILPTDEILLKELFYSHSARTILHRYFAAIHDLPLGQLHRFVTLDYQNDFALVGLVSHGQREQMICVGRYFRDPAGTDAELAVTVHDDFQGCGLGTYLVRVLVSIAQENGIRAFTASVLADNQAMMHVFHKVAAKIEAVLETDVYAVRFDLADVPAKM